MIFTRWRVSNLRFLIIWFFGFSVLKTSSLVGVFLFSGLCDALAWSDHWSHVGDTTHGDSVFRIITGLVQGIHLQFEYASYDIFGQKLQMFDQLGVMILIITFL